MVFYPRCFSFVTAVIVQPYILPLPRCQLAYTSCPLGHQVPTASDCSTASKPTGSTSAIGACVPRAPLFSRNRNTTFHLRVALSYKPFNLIYGELTSGSSSISHHTRSTGRSIGPRRCLHLRPAARTVRSHLTDGGIFSPSRPTADSLTSNNGIRLSGAPVTPLSRLARPWYATGGSARSRHDAHSRDLCGTRRHQTATRL